MKEKSAHKPEAVIRRQKVQRAFVLICMSVIIGFLANISVLAGVPDLISPFPFAVIVPHFSEVPTSVVTLTAIAVFAIPQLCDLSETPNSRVRIGLSALLLLFTGLSAAWLIYGWSYGLEYQGARYTQGVLWENIIVGVIAWSTWYLSRRSGHVQMRQLFAFFLFIWIFWCGLPYLGELP